MQAVNNSYFDFIWLIIDILANKRYNQASASSSVMDRKAELD
jgi:hypothetical protein